MPATRENDIRLYTPREAAAILKVHERTVLRWVETGKLAARRIGRLVRIEEESLRAYGKPSSSPAKARRAEGKIRKAGKEREPRKGSPAALLRCAGLLTQREAQGLLETIRQADVVDWEEPVEIPA